MSRFVALVALVCVLAVAHATPMNDAKNVLNNLHLKSAGEQSAWLHSP
jgi:hypothetical protein